eukprot:809773_1
MKLSRFAKLSVLVVLLASAAIGVNGACNAFGKAQGTHYNEATVDADGIKSETDATVTCPDGFLLNTDGYLGTSQTFKCPTDGTGDDGWVPKKDKLGCFKGKAAAIPMAGHWAADMSIGLFI